MSLITRCPACQTLFKVVPDQLRISEGWVRCGQCAAVFDASLHLLPQAPDALPPQTPDALPQAPDALPQVAEDAPPSAPLEHTDDAQPEPPRALPDPPASAEPEERQEQEQSPVLESSSDAADVSFLRDQRQRLGWRKPMVRVMLVFLTLALLLGLAGQILFHERDRLVALKPGLRPWLLAFCSPLHCTLSPLRQKDAIVIDSASFTKLREDTYRLNFSLKNTASMALALPAIELTLTDSREQPVLRRVFSSAELGAKSDTLAAGSEWQSSLTVGVNGTSKAERIVGYSLYAFYP